MTLLPYKYFQDSWYYAMQCYNMNYIYTCICVQPTCIASQVVNSCCLGVFLSTVAILYISFVLY